MRVRLEIDSATDEEAKAFVFAFQRTRHALMEDSAKEPCVRLAGVGWGVTTAPLAPHHAALMMEDFSAWVNDRNATNLMRLVDPPTPTPIYGVDRKEQP